jgi:phosphopantetheinyl transferase
LLNTLLHINESNGLQVVVAEFSEIKNSLLQTFYSTQEQQEFEVLSSEKRQAERAATLFLLHDFFGIKNALHHHSGGAPYLAESNVNISISHTQKIVAIALHPTQKVGVDVENTQRNFGCVAARFLSDKEKEFCTTQTLQCLAWCAKETIFKIANEQGVDFASQIILEKFEEKNEGEILAHFFGKEKNKSCNLRYHLIGNRALTYCIS